jgi:hypothetical protein
MWPAVGSWFEAAREKKYICEPEEYREKYLQPQLGLFEAATTLEPIVEEGDLRREQVRNKIFFENACSHCKAAVREPQNPRPAPQPDRTPRGPSGACARVTVRRRQDTWDQGSCRQNSKRASSMSLDE